MIGFWLKCYWKYREILPTTDKSPIEGSNDLTKWLKLKVLKRARFSALPSRGHVTKSNRNHHFFEQFPFEVERSARRSKNCQYINSLHTTLVIVKSWKTWSLFFSLQIIYMMSVLIFKLQSSLNLELKIKIKNHDYEIMK